MYVIRAEEAERRDVDHFSSCMKEGDLAPVCNPKLQVHLALRKYVKDVMTVWDSHTHINVYVAKTFFYISFLS